MYGEGNDGGATVKATASRKRKTPEEEQAVMDQAAAIDYKVTPLLCFPMCPCILTCQYIVESDLCDVVLCCKSLGQKQIC